MSGLPPLLFPQERPRNFLDTIFENRKKQEDQLMMANFAEAAKADPDKAAEAQRLGIELDIDSLVVERNIEKVRALKTQQRARLLAASEFSPILRLQLRDPEFARIAHDDLDNLGFIEGITKGWETGELTTERGFLGERVRRGIATPAEIQRLAGVNQRLMDLPASSDGMFMASARFLGQMSRTIPQAAVAGVGGGLAAASTVGFLGSLGPQAFIPEELLSVPSAFFFGARAGFATQLALTSFQVEAGNAFLDMTEGENPLDEELARNAASVVGFINAGLELTGVGLATAPLRRNVSRILAERLSPALIRPTRTAALARFTIDMAASTAGETVTEILQEVSNIGGELLAGGSPENVAQRLADIAEETLKGMILLSVPGAALNFHHRVRKVNQAKAAQQFFDDLSKGVEVSEVLKRSPQSFMQYLQATAEGTAVENLYLQAEKVQEAIQEAGITAEALNRQMPGFAEKLNNALQDGGDVVIPTAQYQTQVATRPDLDKVLRPHIRIDADAISGAEQQFFQANRQGPLTEEARKQLEAELKKDKAFQQSAQRVKDSLLEQIKAVTLPTKITDAQAQAAAIATRDFVKVQAAQIGVTPEEFARRFPLRVRIGNQTIDLSTQFRQERQAAAREGRPLSARQQLAQERRVSEERRAEDVGPPEGVPERRVGEVDRRVAPSPLRQTDQEGASLGLEEGGFDPDATVFGAPPTEFFQGAQAPASLYSALNQEIEVLTVKGQAARGWRSTLKGLVKKGKVKQAEIDATGLNDWLDLQDGKISKEAVQGFLSQNGVVIQRIELGDRGPEKDRLLTEAQELETQIRESPFEASEGQQRRLDALNQRLDELPDVSVARFGEYVVPGGENYREILLSLTPEEDTRSVGDIADEALRRIRERGLDVRSAEVQERVMDEVRAEGAPLVFRSNHFPSTPNLVAHIRMDDRVDANGNRVLFVQEIQSDWAQKGRRRGFDRERILFQAFYETESGGKVPIGFGETAEAAIENARAGGWTDEQQTRLQVQTEGLTTPEPAPRGIPLAPFVTNTKGWVNLALKQVLLEAVNGGYDRVSFITGEQSAAFYDLSQRVDSLEWFQPEGRETGLLTAVKDGEIVVSHGEITPAQLPEFIGKGPAEALLAATPEESGARAIVGEELRVGGQGMLEFYDSIIPQAMGKLAKKLGGPKMAPAEIVAGSAAGQPVFSAREMPDTGQWVVMDDALNIATFRQSREAAEQEAARRNAPTGLGPRFVVRTDPVEGFEVTDAQTGDVAAFAETREEADAEAARRNEAAQAEVPATAAEAGFTVEEDRGQFVVLNPQGKPVAFRETQADANLEAERLATDPSLRAGEQASLEITPELREEVQQAGLPLFQEGQEGPRGAFDPENLIVTLFKAADVSTLLHESAHYYLEVLTQMAAGPNAPARVVRDLETFLDWADGGTLQEWLGQSMEERRRVHEVWAFSFEQYMFEGKAPSRAMEDLFQRFRRWIRLVYRSIRGELNAIYRAEFGEDLPVLTPEVRQVFDRLLATDEAITMAEEVRSMRPLFQTQQEAKATDEDWERYTQLIELAHEAGITKLTKDSLRQIQWLSRAKSREAKKAQAEHDEVRAKIREEEAEGVRRMPVYRAQTYLRTGDYTTELGEVEPTPGVHRMDTELVRALLPEDASLRDLSGMTTQGGVTPDDVAQNFGFASGQELITALLNIQPQQQLVDQLTDERMMLEHADMLDPAQVEARIEEALHNEVRARFLAVESKFLTGSTQPVRLIMGAAKAAAQDAILNTPVGELRTRDFSIAEGRAARASREASAKGDSALAREKHLQQRLQHHLATESAKALTRIDKVLNRRTGAVKGTFRKIQKSDRQLAKTRNIDFVGAARAIAHAWGLGPAEDPAVPHLSQVEKYAPQRHEDLLELVTNATAGAKNWRDATVDEFLTMQEAVDALWFLSRRDKVVTLDGKRVEVGEAAGEVVAGINAPAPEDLRRPLTEKEQKSLRDGNWRAWITRVESWVIMLDGGKGPGPVHKWLFQPLRRAFDNYHQERILITKVFNDRVNDLDLGDGTSIAAGELREGFSFNNKAELIGALKHSGNLSNLRKLILGERWIEEQADGSEIAFDTTTWWAFIDRMIRDGVLTKKDFEYAQFIWDTYDKLLPRLQNAHFESYGFRFEEVAAEPIEVTFKGDTEPTLFRGGYVPATTDTMRREVQVDPVRMDDPLADNSRHIREQLTPAKGFTFSRVEYNKPLVLSVKMDAHHIDEHLRFIHMEVPSKDILRLLRDKDVADAISAIDPHAVRHMFFPWLTATVTNSVLRRGLLATKWENWFVHLRKASGAGIMFAKLTTGLQQLSGLGQSLIHVKLKYLRSSSVAYMAGGQGARAFEKSTFMRLRIKENLGQIRDDIDVITKPGWMTNITEWTDKHAFFMQRFFQAPVDVITWNARYEQGIAENLTEDQAIAAADSAVRLSQGSGTAPDISRLERGDPITRLILQFSNFWFTTYNSIAQRQGTERLKALAVTTAFAGLVAGVIVRVLNGGWDDEDDDSALWDDVAEATFRDMLSGLVAARVPVIGPAFQGVLLGEFGGRIGLGGAGISTLEQAISGVAFLPMTAVNLLFGGEAELKGSDVKDLAALVALLTGLPLVQPGRQAAYGVDVLRDDVRPQGVFGLPAEADLLRGLLTGKESPGSRR